MPRVGPRDRPSGRTAPWLPVCAMLIFGAAPPAQAQFFAECDSGSRAELERNIRAHGEHMLRLQKKLVTGWYWQGPLPAGFRPIDLDGVRASLSRMSPRKAAVLFHAYSERGRKLCVWLISAGAAPVSAVVPVADIGALRPQLLNAAGVARRSLPVRKADMSKAQFEAQLAALDAELSALERPPAPAEALASAANALLPEKIIGAMLQEAIDTLIVMPVFDLGVVPYAALPIDGDRMLIDVASVLVAPGFFALGESPRAAKKSFAGALVVGNPYREDADWHLAPLPGAEAEAREIAAMFGTQPLIGASATRKAVLARLRRQPPPPLVYFASHGIADDANPLDGGFLALSDGRWTGRNIVRQVPRTIGRPLVVLSACQTGLGKNFDVGTIGLARAWQEAGASNVVMSLWPVGDRDTMRLMTLFMRHVRSLPPDKALREAMLERRQADPRIAAWASFAVFGAPER